ncbi:PilN domain-containing protein [Chloroflexota bacterium]
MAGKITTLYIDTGSLRLVISRGKKILEWAYLPLERELVSDNQVIGESELALKIKQLLSEHNVQGRNVLVALSGLHCISRPVTLPHLPGDMLDEAVKREARRLLPVPLEQMYLSWQKIPGSEDQSNVFMVAVPCITIDSVVNTLYNAGLTPVFLGIKPLFLAKSVDETSAIIVDVQAGEFDIIIVTNGIPQTVRTVTFAENALSPERKMNTITNELTRTVSFYNTNNSENQLAPDVPIIVSGQLAEGTGLYQGFSSFDEYPLLPLQYPLDYPEGFNPDLYSANMGMVLYQLRKRNINESSFVVQNSLPAQYLPKPISPINIFGIPGAVLAVIFIAFLIMNNLNISGNIDSVTARESSAEQALQERLLQRQQIAGEIEELKGDISQAEISRDNYNLVVTYMEEQRNRISRGLSEVVSRLSTSITLENIAYMDTTMQLDGRVKNEKDVLQYIVLLESSGLFGEIVISNMEINEDLSHTFTLLIDTSEAIGETSGIDVILRYFPIDVSLISLSQADDTTTINANAPDEESIILFLKELEKSGLFQEIALDSQTSIADGSINFVFTVKGIE